MLDAPTLLIVAAFVAGLLGLFLLAMWMQERNIRALAWWGVAYLVGGAAVTLWSAQERVGALMPELPNALLFVACGMIWNGARLFHGKPPRPFGLAAGAAIWVAAMQAEGFAQSDPARVVLSSLVIATYTFLASRELRSDRRRSGADRRLALVVPLLHGAVFLSPIPLALLMPQGGSQQGWFVLFALETLLYVIGTAFIVVVMAKERVTLIHKTAAMTDPLTGLFNRRAFFEAAQAMAARQARKGAAVSVLAFDLDHFKSINDRFGHAAGDEALRAFAATAAATLRSTDVVGRIGGEEFVAILPATLPEAAMAGERVRAAYEAAGRVIAGHAMGSTVSIGAASAMPPADVERLLARADAALYRAKKGGRNRVATAEPEEGAPPQPTPAPARPRAVPPTGRAAPSLR